MARAHEGVPFQKHVCTHCGEKARHICSTCERAYYCSDECCAKDAESHKPMCIDNSGCGFNWEADWSARTCLAILEAHEAITAGEHTAFLKCLWKCHSKCPFTRHVPDGILCEDRPLLALVKPYFDVIPPIALEVFSKHAARHRPHVPKSCVRLNIMRRQLVRMEKKGALFQKSKK